MTGSSLHRSARDHRTRTITVLFAISLVATIFAVRVPLGYLPEASQKHIAIVVRYDNAFPEEIEENVTVPVENAIAADPGVDVVSSHIQAGQSRTVLTISQQANLDSVMMDVSASVQRVARGFPSAAHRPVLVKSDPESAPVFIVGLSAEDGWTERELRSIFEGVDGTGQVDVIGAPRPEVLVTPREFVHRSSALKRGVLMQALIDRGHPRVIRTRSGTSLVYDGRVDSLQAIETTPTPIDGLTIGSLAGIRETQRTHDSISRIDGERGVSVFVRSAGDANPVSLSRALRAVTRTLPRARVLYDYGTLVEAALRQIGLALIVGMVLVALVTAFLVDRAAAPALAISIPFSALISVAAISALGATLDIMALGGIVLGVGIAIDTGIVYVDALDRNNGDVTRAWKATAGVLVVSTSTTLVIFAPLIFAGADLLVRYRTIALSFSATVVATFAFTWLAVPALIPGTVGSRRAQRVPGDAGTEPSEIPRTNRAVLVTLSLAVGSAALLGAGGVAAAALNRLPVSKPSVEGDSRVDVFYDVPAGTDFDELLKRSRDFERALIGSPAVRTVVSRYEGERAEFRVFPAEARDAGPIQTLVDAAQRGDPTATVLIAGGSATDRWIPILIGGNSHTDVRMLAHEVADDLSGLLIPRARFVFHFKEPIPSQTLRLHSAILADHASGPAAVTSDVFSYLSEPVVFKLQIGGPERDLRVVRGGGDHPSLGDLLDHPVLLGERTRRVAAIGEVLPRERPTSVSRRDLRPAAAFSIVVPSEEERNALATVEERLARYPLPSGYTALVDPAYYSQIEAGRELVKGLAIGAVLVLLVLLAYFQAMRKALAALLVVPLAMVLPLGVFALRAGEVSEALLVGLAITAGVAVNHAVLVLNHTTEGRTVWAALQEKRRAMGAATATTIAGIVPVLIQSSTAGSPLTQLTLSLSLGSVGAVIVTHIAIPLVMSIGRSGDAPRGGRR